MNELFKEVIAEIKPLLIEQGFKGLGKSDFVRDTKDPFKRREKISIHYIINPCGGIFISAAVGLYYPEVSKIQKIIINDHLIDYPLVASSVGHYTPENNYTSIPLANEEMVSDVVKDLLATINKGGSELFNTLPSLESIYEGILNKHPYLEDEWKFPRNRTHITISSIICLLKGNEQGILWLQTYGDDKKLNEKIMIKMRSIEL